MGLIEPSPLNPRKSWKPERVAAMAADMRANSQIQPIRVRANPRHTAGNGRPPYEIVVGETRWRAAPDAGLATLDAIVADCTDHQLIQLALAENTKRQDLNALEEADAFDALLRKPDGLQGYSSVPEMAAALGVSPSYIYQRLKLRNLCQAGRDAFLAGRIDASTAVLIARMPDQAEQSRAAVRIVAGFGGDPYSYRQASEMLKREFMLRLDLARFDLTASYQVAGPCADCHKRSGAAPDLFADVTGGDMCQDARCYRAKAEAAHQLLLQAARDSGRTVLQGAKARAVLRDASAEPVGHYRLDRPCPALTDSTRPLSALLGHGFAGSVVVVDLGEDTMPAELVPVEVARRAIKARGLLRKDAANSPAAPAATTSQKTKAGDTLFTPKPAPPAGMPPSAGHAPQEGEGGEEDDGRARLKFGELLLSELAAALENAPELPLVVLRCTLAELLADLSAEECTLVLAVFRVPRPAAAADFNAAFDGVMQACNGRELGELLALVLAVRDCFDVPESLDALGLRPAGALARHFGTDLQKLQRWAQIARHAPAVTDATAAFLAAHASSQPAARADEVQRPAAAETADGSAPGLSEANAWEYPNEFPGPRG